MNIIADEPVITGAIVSILTAVISRYGFNLSPDLLAAVTSIVTAVVSLAVRHFVTPTTKKAAPPAPPAETVPPKAA